MIFDVCTTSDTAHIGMIFKFLPHTRQHGCFLIAQTSSCLYDARMVLSVGGSFAYFARNARCTVTTDLLCDIPTHKTTFFPERPFSHYITSHRLAAEMWTTMKSNLLAKQFLSCSFYLYRFHKYVSYGFRIINFCNLGVHYETPCMQWEGQNVAAGDS